MRIPDMGNLTMVAGKVPLPTMRKSERLKNIQKSDPVSIARETTVNLTMTPKMVAKSNGAQILYLGSRNRTFSYCARWR
jgi:hypothetical protein